MPVYNHVWYDSNRNTAPAALLAHGPTLEVEIHVPSALASALAQANQPIPAPIAGFGVIDTGATFSAVHRDAAIQLGLQPLRQTTTNTAAGPQVQDVYPVGLNLPGVGRDFDFSALVGVDLSGHKIQGIQLVALIGRDLLANCLFVYNGPHATFILSW